MLLLVGAGVLNALFSVLFYVLIAEIGPVLTTLIIATSPIFAILGGMVFLRDASAPAGWAPRSRWRRAWHARARAQEAACSCAAPRRTRR